MTMQRAKELLEADRDECRRKLAKAELMQTFWAGEAELASNRLEHAIESLKEIERVENAKKEEVPA